MELHRPLDTDLESLRNRLLLLGGETEAAFAHATYALVARDSDAAREVLRDDDAIDQLEVEIDRLCVDVLALRQPAARDLRFVVAVAKITPILERIADHACNIARAAIDLNDEPQLAQANADLPRMAEHAAAMLRAALDAFTSNDAAQARALIARDDEIDILYDRVFHDL
ncbi:MAG TPA: phosphate signaling complex protein PhoU, partial [Pyrinomonadaceae bacterium]|nr:phosphate signaling complex protein PhoU [Pyrinomonadaceae bacterium]